MIQPKLNNFALIDGSYGVTHAQAAKLLVDDLSGIVRSATASHARPGNTGSEEPQKDVGAEKMNVLATRMLLQIFSVPSLMTYLADFAVVPSDGPGGKYKVQFDFIKLPKDILPDLEKLLSVDYFKNHKLVKYIKSGQARTGLEVEVTPKDDMPGTAYDYAF